MSRLIEHSIRRVVPAPNALTHSVQRLLAVGACLCVFCVGPLCGPPLRWWVLCGALPSVWVPCAGPLCGSPVWVPCVGPLCVGPLCGSPVWVPRCAASCCIYSRDASRSFTRSRLHRTFFIFYFLARGTSKKKKPTLVFFFFFFNKRSDTNLGNTQSAPRGGERATVC